MLVKAAGSANDEVKLRLAGGLVVMKYEAGSKSELHGWEGKKRTYSWYLLSSDCGQLPAV